jgi:hypothetical protein
MFEQINNMANLDKVDVLNKNQKCDTVSFAHNHPISHYSKF